MSNDEKQQQLKDIDRQIRGSCIASIKALEVMAEFARKTLSQYPADPEIQESFTDTLNTFNEALDYFRRITLQADLPDETRQ